MKSMEKILRTVEGKKEDRAAKAIKNTEKEKLIQEKNNNWKITTIRAEMLHILR